MKVLLPEKVWLEPSLAMLLDNLESASVPEAMLLALRLDRPEPLPVKVLPELVNLLMPEKVWLPFSLARLVVSIGDWVASWLIQPADVQTSTPPMVRPWPDSE